MNNKELQSAIASKMGVTKQEAELLLKSLTSAMVTELSEGKTINIQGFGHIEVRKKAERISVNPSTQERKMVPEKLALAFKPSAILKEKIKDIQGNE